jgi:hypothetical protein
MKEQFEGIKWIIRSRKSKKDGNTVAKRKLQEDK